MDKDRRPPGAAATHVEVQSAVNGGALAHGDGKSTTGPPPWRWVMLGVLSADICVSYLPYYTFVPILPQARREYGVEEDDINVLCILYAMAFVLCAFITGPTVGRLGCRWTFVLAMGFTAGGCALRCGPEFADQFFYSDFQLDQAQAAADPASKARAFRWLLVGQAFCALGQPFLVNSCSHMGAEWFPPTERPAAAMISNLMNFIGSSLSFMLPSMVVDVHADESSMSDQQIHQELASLLSVQFRLAAAFCVLTLLVYQSGPEVPVLHAHRAQVSFFEEVRRFIGLRDFWLVNGQFMIYVSVCHAFDAIEGSLLEHYGYGANLSSWTAVSCSVTAVISTMIEAVYITDPASYQPALVAVNVILAASMVLGFLSLRFQLHEAAIIVAVGVMGLSTPGWGCSCELGSEVCFPAREATVSSFLEACSNLTAVVGILTVQRLLDAGLGAAVLLVMGANALLGGALLLGLSGRYRRKEAEHMVEIEVEGFHAVEDQHGCALHPTLDASPSFRTEHQAPPHEHHGSVLSDVGLFAWTSVLRAPWPLRWGSPAAVDRGPEEVELAAAAARQPAQALPGWEREQSV